MVDKKNNSAGKSFRAIGLIAIVVAIGVVAVWLKLVRGSDMPAENLSTFVAQRGPLTISVLESGTIKAREQIVIKNEVEGRTSIITLVPEGVRVKEGDLLVELDASNLKDTKIDQEIKVQNAEAAHINAIETFAVVENQAESDIDVAKLTLKFAKQDLDQYEKGRYPNEEKAATAKITLAEEEVTRAKETLDWSRTLYDEKYISKTQLQADELAWHRATLDVELAKNDLDLLENFTYHRNIDQLKSDVRQAEMALERTERKARADVAQAKADLKAKELEYKRQQDKFAKIEDQIKKATIRAPADGMVIYATSARRGGWRDNRQPLDEGVEVFERQELIYLPTATSAMAEVDIHEASLEKVRLGLPAIITVDALPGKKFIGSVGRIAPLPDPQSMWMNPDLKVYNSEIYLEGEEPALRTGMSCKVEIIVAQHEDAVYVPVQAVIRIAGQPAAYVVKEGSIEQREVEIGLDNNRMVRIIDGIREGQVVLLTPPLKSAGVAGAGEPIDTDAFESTDTLAAIKQRINQKLEEVNGTQTRAPSGGAGLQQEGPPRPMGRGQEPVEGAGGAAPSAQQMEQMRKRFENMSPEERQKEIEKMRRRFENMTPEEREKMRQRFQGRGPRQGAGRRQEQAPEQGGGRTPRESERNQ